MPPAPRLPRPQTYYEFSDQLNISKLKSQDLQKEWRTGPRRVTSTGFNIMLRFNVRSPRLICQGSGDGQRQALCVVRLPCDRFCANHQTARWFLLIRDVLKSIRIINHLARDIVIEFPWKCSVSCVACSPADSKCPLSALCLARNQRSSPLSPSLLYTEMCTLCFGNSVGC